MRSNIVVASILSITALFLACGGGEDKGSSGDVGAGHDGGGADAGPAEVTAAGLDEATAGDLGPEYDLILAPVLTFGDRHEMTGGSALVPRVHREAVLKALVKGADAWKLKRPESSLREQLRGSLLPAFRALREAYANVKMPEIRNSDGDEIVYSTAT